MIKITKTQKTIGDPGNMSIIETFCLFEDSEEIETVINTYIGDEAEAMIMQGLSNHETTYNTVEEFHKAGWFDKFDRCFRTPAYGFTQYDKSSKTFVKP